jgi:hypothetical protein
MRKMICLGFLLLLCGCAPVKEAFTPCDKTIDGAVLDKLYPRFKGIPNYLGIWLSGNYDNEYWNPEFQRWQQELTKCREWAERLQDHCLRNAYIHWLDYYQHELDSAKNELMTKNEKQEMDSFREKNERERKAREEYERNHTVPECPKCP